MVIIGNGWKGVPDIRNTPGSRLLSNGWVYNGKLFLYGGYGGGATFSPVTRSVSGNLQDLWQYK